MVKNQKLDYMDENFVYWIRLDNFSIEEGYIGVTKYPERRFKHHLKHNKNIDKNSTLEIIFKGSREECFLKEFELRPKPKMGWNRAIGGSQGWKLGFSHSEETKSKLKNKWSIERKTELSKSAIKRNKEKIGNHYPKLSISSSGERNGMFGKTHSEDSKTKMRNARIGKTPHNAQNLFCIFCRKKASLSILIKYHGLNRKNCKGKIE